MLAADMIRFRWCEQDILWNAFAKRGLGEGEVSNGAGDVDPTPSFTSPFANEGNRDVPAGRRERRDRPRRQAVRWALQARAVPVADTDPATPLTGAAGTEDM